MREYSVALGLSPLTLQTQEYWRVSWEKLVLSKSTGGLEDWSRTHSIAGVGDSGHVVAGILKAEEGALLLLGRAPEHCVVVSVGFFNNSHSRPHLEEHTPIAEGDGIRVEGLDDGEVGGSHEEGDDGGEEHLGDEKRY